jgi:limonene-1,2-epoxide hydrolase
MDADPATTEKIRALVERAYAAMSAPGGDVAAVFGHEDMAVAGSGQSELMYGPDRVIAVAEYLATRGTPWVPEQIRVWRHGDVAWAQILGYVEVHSDGGSERVPYWTTGVFGLEDEQWQWRYWGGSEPQEHPRV